MKMHNKVFFLLSLYCLAILPVFAQTAIADSSVIGTWKGTSICQVKNSPCHDEVVVYHVTRGSGQDTFDIRADKIVNGKQEDMGVLTCRLDRKIGELLSTAYNGIWTFQLRGNKMEGTLIFRGQLYRIISLAREP